MTVGLTAHVLRIAVRAREPIELDEHPGSSLRGALFHALLRRFCMNPQASSCAECPLNATCPVASLVAPLRDESPRGRDVPRPFVLGVGGVAETVPAESPLTPRRLETGDQLCFDLSLFGRAATLFPYVAMSMTTIEVLGFGRRVPELGGRRGRPHIMHIEAINPFTGATQRLYTRDQANVSAPALPITAETIAARAATLPTDRLTLHFVTPTRLVADGQLMRTPHLRTLALRLAERLDALEREYAPNDPSAPELDRHARYLRTGELSAGVRLVANDTHWVDVASYSARQRRTTPIGGFVGRATYEGDLRDLRDLLVWGELLHAGKNAVKGDGLYRIEA